MEVSKISGYPEIDLSVVTFNSARWLEPFFLSLSSQQFPPSKIHVFVRDNGSTDETVKLLEEIRSKEARFASFQIEAGENAGFGEGHNANLKRGSSPYFLVCNPDLTFEQEAISRIATHAMSDEPRVASWEFRQKPYEHPKYYNPITMHTSWSSGACILFRREAIMQVGGFEPRIFMYGEDVELSYRLRAEGFILKYCPAATCWHHTYHVANETKPLQFINSKLGNAYIRLRYGNWRQVFEIIPLFAALLLMPQRFSGQRYRVLKATFRLLGDTPYFLRGRKAGKASFPFHRFDYERRRTGAFYEYRLQAPDNPLVSVIIRTRKGRQACLKEAVATVLNQTYPNIELIVVEEGTTTSREFVQYIAAGGALASVRYLNVETEGRSRAGNAALAAATGEYLCFLDDDDLFFADHIEVLAQEMMANPQAGAAYGDAWQVVTHVESAAEWKYRELSYKLVCARSFDRVLRLHKKPIPNQSILFRKALYQQHGGFNESLQHKEDRELWTRYASNNDFVHVPKLTSLYRVLDSRDEPA